MVPRPNKPRSLAEEANLARRVAYERERRGWTYEGLAKRMTDAGCPVNASALYKIEKSDPPRRITVAELVAMAQVFGASLDELLLPPEAVEQAEAVALVRTFKDALGALQAAQQQAREATAALAAYAHDHQPLEDFIEAEIRAVGDSEDAAAFADALLTELFTPAHRRRKAKK